MRTAAILTAAALLVTGCGTPGADSIGSAVVEEMRPRFEGLDQYVDGEFSVEDVELTETGENRYRGSLIVSVDGAAGSGRYEVPIEVRYHPDAPAESSNVTWEMDTSVVEEIIAGNQ